jgi:adenosine deaminase
MNELHAHVSGSLKGADLFNIICRGEFNLNYAARIDSLTAPLGFRFYNEIITYGLDTTRARFIDRYPCLPNGTKRFSEIMDRFKLTAFVLEVVPDAIELMVEAVCRDFEANGVSYAEWRIDPFSSTKGQTAEEGLAKLRRYYAVMKGIGIESKLILGAAKNRYVRPDGSANRSKIAFLRKQTQAILDSGKDLPIVGLDAVNGEVVSISDLAPFLSLAEEYGIGLVPHVGECGSSTLEENLKTVEDAIAMGAKRLGHAVSMYMSLDDYLGSADSKGHLYDKARINRLSKRQESLLELVRQKNIAVEVCPTSNLSAHLGLKSILDHPVRRLVEFGVPFVVGSDDCGIFGKTLLQEVEAVSEVTGINSDRILAFNRNYSLARTA